MIFNTFVYYLVFLLPAAVLFRVSSPRIRPWICAAFGIGFFIYFSAVQFGGWWGASCVLIFIWEALFRWFYRPRAIVCFIGIGISLIVLGAFKYWNFLTGLVFESPGENSLRWEESFLPLGVSFFTFEFIHYAADRYRGKVERGTFGEYLAFIFFFPTLVAGPIKRFQDFAACLRNPTEDWGRDWNRGITRIMAGLV